MIEKRESINKELTEIKMSASGLSGAIFRAFSKIFDIDIFNIILVGNIFVALLLETVISSFVIINFQRKENNVLIGTTENNNGHHKSKKITEKVENFDKVDIENNRKIFKDLKSDFKKSGKSDKTILHFWDNGIINKSKIGRLVKDVIGYKVSRQYVDQVIKRERQNKKVVS